MNTARVRAYIYLLIVTAIWGIAGPIIKFTLGGFDPLTFLTYRFGLSSILAILTFAVVKIRLPKDKETFFRLIGFGFLTSTVSLGFLFFGLENTTVLDMSLITLATPLLVTIAGVMFLNEHVTRMEKIGMGIALFGTLLTVIEPLIQNGHDAIRLSGNIFIVGSLIATAWSAVLAKELLRKDVSPLLMTNASFIVGFLSLLPFAIFLRPSILYSLFTIHYTYHIGVFYMALLSGSLAYYLSNKAQKSIEIGEASIFAYLYPIFSTPLAVIWLGEKITPMFTMGAVIIAIGVAIAEIKKRRYN
ncbi:MAG: DMT family transporter [Patescibacteria group bacterium]